MKAIILAAGYGSRMYPLAQDVPKCLLTIKGETLLARHLRILRGCGIEDITVVTGFHQERIVERYGEEVSIRYNPHYEITGSIFSLWVARDLLTDDVVIMVSDVIFTEEPLNNLLANDNIYCMVIDNKPCDEEARKVKVAGNVIVETSKMMPPKEAFGEFAYFAKIKREGTEAFSKSLFECVRKDSNSDWPDTFSNLLSKGHTVNFVLINSPWIEIDTEEDYKEAKRLFGTKSPSD